MQVVGVGTGIVECLRIGRMIERYGELFLTRVYTPGEIRYCQTRIRAIQQFTAHWAAKEATLRALGAGRLRGIRWRDVEIRVHRNGHATAAVCGRIKEIVEQLAIAQLVVSMSHCHTHAMAFAIALREH